MDEPIKLILERLHAFAGRFSQGNEPAVWRRCQFAGLTLQRPLGLTVQHKVLLNYISAFSTCSYLNWAGRDSASVPPPRKNHCSRWELASKPRLSSEKSVSLTARLPCRACGKLIIAKWKIPFLRDRCQGRGERNITSQVCTQPW